jgi:hypothetical protein
MADQLAGWKELVASDRDVTDVVVRGLADFGQLSPADQARFDLSMRAFLYRTDSAIDARNAGLIPVLNPNVEQRAMEGDLIRYIRQPGFAQWWANVDRRGIPPTTVALTDEPTARLAASEPANRPR